MRAQGQGDGDGERESVTETVDWEKAEAVTGISPGVSFLLTQVSTDRG